MCLSSEAVVAVRVCAMRPKEWQFPGPVTPCSQVIEQPVHLAMRYL